MRWGWKASASLVALAAGAVGLVSHICVTNLSLAGHTSLWQSSAGE
jgi:hypothetical protein